MTTTDLVILDHVSGINATALQAFASALDEQINEDVAPAWGRFVTPWVGTNEAVLSPNAWRLHIWKDQQSAADAGALGHHETQGKDHVPIGHVFIKSCVDDGETWTTVASHEALEMVGDEWINLDVTRIVGHRIQLWPRELCDAVQGTHYMKRGVLMSNFVLPEYFIDGADGPFDQMHILHRPFEIHHTGYSAIREITNAHVRERAIYGAAYPEAKKEPRKFSRRASRFAARACGFVSAVV